MRVFFFLLQKYFFSHCSVPFKNFSFAPLLVMTYYVCMYRSKTHSAKNASHRQKKKIRTLNQEMQAIAKKYKLSTKKKKLRI